MNKFCPVCKINKNENSFYRRKASSGGLRSCCIECFLKRASKYYVNNKEKHKKTARKYYLRTLYSLTPEQYEEMAMGQKGRCKICARTPRETLAVDHNHADLSGKPRGLLCRGCNAALGLFQDDPTILRAAALYLEGRL